MRVIHPHCTSLWVSVQFHHAFLDWSAIHRLQSSSALTLPAVERVLPKCTFICHYPLSTLALVYAVTELELSPQMHNSAHQQVPPASARSRHQDAMRLLGQSSSFLSRGQSWRTQLREGHRLYCLPRFSREWSSSCGQWRCGPPQGGSTWRRFNFRLSRRVVNFTVGVCSLANRVCLMFG